MERYLTIAVGVIDVIVLIVVRCMSLYNIFNELGFTADIHKGTSSSNMAIKDLVRMCLS
jgi:hypothetical protein